MNKVDSFFASIKDKKVAFLGIGKSNLPLIYKFLDRGIDVYACDKRDESSIDEDTVTSLKSAVAAS